MEFVFGVVSFVLGTVLVAICLVAIPGPTAVEQSGAPPSHGHGGH